MADTGTPLRRFALLGDPVAHSASPRLHNAAFAAAGIAAEYGAERVTARELGGRLRALAEAGGGGNVTVPHKRLAVASLDHASEGVRRTGAVNTFWLGPGGVQGENTDVPGFLAALAHHGLDLRGEPVLLLGAGGAAAAVLYGLLQLECAVTVVNRSPARAHALVERVAGGAPVRVAGLPPREGCAAVVNATSLGMHSGDPHPLAISDLPRGAAVVDLVYAPRGTSWVAAARAAGHFAFDGTEMLLQQAAAAFSIWTGLPAPLEVMRRALAAAD